MKAARVLLLTALICCVLSACQTPQTFPQPDATWRTRVGQLQYSGGGRPPVIGECIVSQRSAGDFQLEFHTGPGFPLMKLSRSGERARAEGVLARGSWQGAPASAPAPLRGWMHVSQTLRADAARRAVIDSPQTGERFVFVFPG